MQEKNYVGQGWLRTFQNGGNIINLSLNLEQLQKLPVDQYGNIKITVAPRREPSEKSKATHTVYEDTYKKEQQAQQPSAPTPDTNTEMPF